MTDYQHDESRPDAASEPLPGSCEPNVTPIFQPIATAPAKTSDEALVILAEEASELAAQEEAMHRDRGALDMTSPEYGAAGDKISPVTDQLQSKWTMAPLIWADTHVGLLAKARIAHSMRFSLEGCEAPEALPLLRSLGQDAERLHQQQVTEMRPEVLKLVRCARSAIDHNSRCSSMLDDVYEAAEPTRPAVPEALFHKASDFNFFHGFRGELSPRHLGIPIRPWYGDAASIKILREQGLRMVDGPQQPDENDVLHNPEPNLAGRARLVEILQAYDTWQSDKADWTDASGIAESSRRSDEAFGQMHQMVSAAIDVRARTLGELMGKASLLMASRAELAEEEASLKSDREGGFDQLERSIVCDLVRLMYDRGFAPLLAASASSVPSTPQAAVDPHALEAYRTWLTMEYRSLTAEMYPGLPRMLDVTAVNNAGDKMHFRGELPASTRAERILDMFGLDWRQDWMPYNFNGGEQHIDVERAA